MTRNEIDQPSSRSHEGFDQRAETHVKAPLLEAPQTDAPVRRHRRSSLLGSLLTVLIIGALVYGAYRYLMPTGEKTAQKVVRTGAGAPQTVGVATIAKGDIEVDIEALGTVTPLANVIVKTQINGQLLQVGFKEGQIVKAGDFLAQIDARPYEALEHQYEGQLARDQGLLDQAKFDLIRYQTLLNQASIARQTAEDQKFIVQQDEGTVKADQRAYRGSEGQHRVLPHARRRWGGALACARSIPETTFRRQTPPASSFLPSFSRSRSSSRFPRT